MSWRLPTIAVLSQWPFHGDISGVFVCLSHNNCLVISLTDFLIPASLGFLAGRPFVGVSRTKCVSWTRNQAYHLCHNHYFHGENWNLIIDKTPVPVKIPDKSVSLWEHANNAHAICQDTITRTTGSRPLQSSQGQRHTIKYLFDQLRESRWLLNHYATLQCGS